jgi:hypothetical protein
MDGHVDVVVSEAEAFGDPETYAFAADMSGAVADWGELSPSRKGFMDWRRLLRDAGYEIVEG